MNRYGSCNIQSALQFLAFLGLTAKKIIISIILAISVLTTLASTECGLCCWINLGNGHFFRLLEIKQETSSYVQRKRLLFCKKIGQFC